jgi:hypothetical protein
MDSHQHTNLFTGQATREATISRRRHGCAIRVLSMAPASAWNVPCPCKIMQRAGTAATGRALPARLGGARPVGQISETGRNLPCLVREALGKPATRDRSRTQSRIPNASAVDERRRTTGPCYNSSNGGTAFGTPWALNAQGTRGGPNIKWALKRAVGKSAAQLSWMSPRLTRAVSRAGSASLIVSHGSFLFFSFLYPPPRAALFSYSFLFFSDRKTVSHRTCMGAVHT